MNTFARHCVFPLHGRDSGSGRSSVEAFADINLKFPCHTTAFICHLFILLAALHLCSKPVILYVLVRFSVYYDGEEAGGSIVPFVTECSGKSQPCRGIKARWCRAWPRAGFGVCVCAYGKWRLFIPEVIHHLYTRNANPLRKNSCVVTEELKVFAVVCFTFGLQELSC